MKRLTIEQKTFIKNSNRTYREIVRDFYEKYNTNIHRSLISYYKSKSFTKEQILERSRVSRWKSVRIQQLKTEEYIALLNKGEVDGLSGENHISSYVRKYMFQQANGHCSECGWSEINKFTQKIYLEIHHKDGNKKNNKLDNLIVLCPNCHSLTPTYKSLNRKNICTY